MAVLVRFGCAVVLLACGSSALAADLIGKVTRNGKPQSGAQVSVESRTKGSKPLTTTTDTAGNYVFSGLTLGTYVLTCNGKTRGRRPSGATGLIARTSNPRAQGDRVEQAEQTNERRKVSSEQELWDLRAKKADFLYKVLISIVGSLLGAAFFIYQHRQTESRVHGTTVLSRERRQ
jgi:hypothetical protein